MISPTCGFDQWIDNHIAIDTTTPILDDVIPKLENTGVHYHIWGGSTGGGFDKLITVYAAGLDISFKFLKRLRLQILLAGVFSLTCRILTLPHHPTSPSTQHTVNLMMGVKDKGFVKTGCSNLNLIYTYNIRHYPH